MTGWLSSSVVECLHGQRKALGSSHNFSPVTPTLCVRANRIKHSTHCAMPTLCVRASRIKHSTHCTMPTLCVRASRIKHYPLRHANFVCSCKQDQTLPTAPCRLCVFVQAGSNTLPTAPCQLCVFMQAGSNTLPTAPCQLCVFMQAGSVVYL